MGVATLETMEASVLGAREKVSAHAGLGADLQMPRTDGLKVVEQPGAIEI